MVELTHAMRFIEFAWKSIEVKIWGCISDHIGQIIISGRQTVTQVSWLLLASIFSKHHNECWHHCSTCLNCCSHFSTEEAEFCEDPKEALVEETLSALWVQSKLLYHSSCSWVWSKSPLPHLSSRPSHMYSEVPGVSKMLFPRLFPECQFSMPEICL